MRDFFRRYFGGYRPVHYSMRVSYWDTLYRASRWH